MAEKRTFYQPVAFNEAVTFLAGAVPVTYGNNVILSLGTGGDAAMVLKSTSTLANTAITSVLIGTPVTPALAADSLIISNTTADGDVLIAGNKGGASQAAVFIDVSVPTIDILVSGVRHLRVATAGTTLGLAGTTAGALLLSGVTSGVVTLKTADAAGTWTMKLPAAVGSAGQQLTDTAGDGITAWAAASLGAWKHDLGILDPGEALAAVVSAPTHRFRYNPAVMPAGLVRLRIGSPCAS